MLLKTKRLMILYPNAKINIGLNVLWKRDDEYHELSSVFYPIYELYDVLEIIADDNFSFSCSGIDIQDETNICIRAFELLKKNFGIGNVRIHLHKRIPIGAGLGGGSADAAFVLKGVNELFSLNINNTDLEKYALELGADCPFFIENTPKYVSGIGDKMQNISLDFTNYKIHFIFPELHISTEKAYSNISPNIPSDHLLDLIKEPIDNWKGKIKNDFETPIFLKYPELEKLKENFYIDGAVYASMTGSGSVLYGWFPNHS